MTSFTPFSALIGGVLIGLSATLLLWTTGPHRRHQRHRRRPAARPRPRQLAWRVAFVLGLVAAPLLFARGRRR